MQLLYYLLSLCSYSQLFAKVLSCTEFVFMFFFKWQFYCFKTCHTIQLWKVYLNVFWLVTSPRIEQQQLSINKFSLNFTRYIPKNCSSNFTIYNTRCKVQEKKLGLGLEDEYMKDITPKNLFLKHQSKYLCCGLQNKII